MATPYFHKVVRSFQWLHILAFGGLFTALLLAIALFWGGQRILEQEREKISLEFLSLTTYLNSQENFLLKLQQQNQSLTQWQEPTSPRRIEQMSLPDGTPYLFAQPALVDIPYSIFCSKDSNCPLKALEQRQVDPRIYAAGDYLSDIYTAYWATSYFPGTTILFLDTLSDFGLAVPAFNMEMVNAPLEPGIVLSAHKAVRHYLLQSPNAKNLHWLTLPSHPNTIIGVLNTPFPDSLWADRPMNTSHIYAVTLFTLQRTKLFQNVTTASVYDSFWLQHAPDALLLGNAPIPGPGVPGTSFSANAVTITLEDQSRSWLGVYQISYLNLIQANLWLLGTSLLLLLLFIASVSTYVRWYRKRVLQPAELAQQVLIDSENFNRTLLETAPVALCVLTRQSGEIVFSNALADTWLNLQTGQKFVHVDQFPAEILHATTAGTVDSLELNGRHLQVAYAPTRYHKQSVILCTFANISTRIAYEQALSQAKTEADTANAAKSRFLAAVSHEIRTPLYGIIGTLELLSISSLNKAQKRHLSRLQQSSTQLMQLISDILDVTKIEADQLVLHEERLNPYQLVQSCVDHYAATARSKNILLFACMDTHIPDVVTGDANRIRQILLNLLNNALKFTHSGQIVARLRAERDDNEHYRFTFQVVDSGIGIRQEDQGKLFTPFYQVHHSGNTLSQGTGLGLSICDSLATLMGGEIKVTSELGLGSSFSLQLRLQAVFSNTATSELDLSGLTLFLRSPHNELTQNLCLWLRHWGANAHAWDAHTQSFNSQDLLIDVLTSHPNPPPHWEGQYLMAGLNAHAHQHHCYVIEGYGAEDIARGIWRYVHRSSLHDTPTEATSPPRLNLHILVAEDNPINQATLLDQLEQLGCTAVMTEDGQEALHNWSPNTFDAVLTDINMPVMNGYDLARQLHQEDATVPIIGVTANAMRDEEIRCREAGMSAWLVKPITLHVLSQCLQKLFPDAVQPNAKMFPVEHMPEAHTTSSTNPLAQAQTELALIPDKYHQLFKDSMLTDAQALIEAAHQADPLAVRHLLHRMQGALLTMKQRYFVQRIEHLQAALHDEETDTEQNLQQAHALGHDLQAVIHQHFD